MNHFYQQRKKKSSIPLRKIFSNIMKINDGHLPCQITYTWTTFCFVAFFARHTGEFRRSQLVVFMVHPVLVHKGHLLKTESKFATNWLLARSCAAGTSKLQSRKKMTNQILPRTNPKVKKQFLFDLPATKPIRCWHQHFSSFLKGSLWKLSLSLWKL